VEYKENEQPKVFVMVQTLQEEAKLESWQLKSKNLESSVKNEERNVKRDEIIENYGGIQ
jgi:hypothetical protein